VDLDRQVAGLTTQPSERHKHIRARGYIGSSALGISDGLLTNLVFLSGFAGAISDIQLIRLAGIASMLAGAISMSFAGFLAQRSEYDLYHADARREAGEIEQEPEEEKSELKNFYTAKGLSQEEADKIVEKISANKAKFLEDILMHELHVHETRLENPIKMGGVIGLSFLVGALIPLTPFILLPTKNTSILAAALIAPLFLFGVGVWRGRIVGRKIWRSGLETLIIGVAASAVLYLIGTALVFV
jgi:predicted membrane protein (TIGR00267 family)